MSHGSQRPDFGGFVTCPPPGRREPPDPRPKSGIRRPRRHQPPRQNATPARRYARKLLPFAQPPRLGSAHMALVVNVPMNTMLADLDETLQTLLKRELEHH